MIYSGKIVDVLSRPDMRGRCFTGLEVIAIAGIVSSVASIGMGIIGSAQQADAQREAGEVAYRNALTRQQQQEAEAKRLENEAKQRDDAANADQAVAQRKGLEDKRRATIAASRASAVMAASGAGVDDGIISGILGEGDLALDTALYEGDVRAQDKRYQGTLNRHEAETRRWAGNTEAAAGARTRSSMYARADNTMATGIGKAIVSGLSLASKYGDGPAPGGGITASGGGFDRGAAASMPGGFMPGFELDGSLT
jgi:type II secretory pathway pseudopilin PulG